MLGTKVRISSDIFLDSITWLVLAVKAQCGLGETETKFVHTVPYINVRLKRIIFVRFHCVHIRVEGTYRAKLCSQRKKKHFVLHRKLSEPTTLPLFCVYVKEAVIREFFSEAAISNFNLVFLKVM